MQQKLTEKSYTSFDSDQFPYRYWGNSDTPETVIIAVHGINGAAQDYDSLGSYISEHLPSSALYAAETRGQGNDPSVRRRGDIYKPSEWYKDLHTFTLLIKEKHPLAKIIWCGESMGSLIVSHAYASYPITATPPCDAMILLAPVVNISHKLPAWKYRLALTIASLLPRFRIPLSLLTGDQSVKVTQGADSHDEQAATNSYFIPKFTLRLIAALGKHIQAMPATATHFKHPTLVINGGNDYLTPPEYVDSFCQNISVDHTHHYYPDAYHLLMYDDQKLEIFSKLTQWTRELPTSASS